MDTTRTAGAPRPAPKRARPKHAGTATRAPFEQVVERHGALVLRICRVVVGPHAAEDAWSETFLAALKAYPRLPFDANVEAWLATIARRKAIDQLRALHREAIPSSSLPEGNYDPSTALDADLLSALAALPPKQRKTITYHYLLGMPYGDIAELIGGTAAAARRAAADGAKALRHMCSASQSAADGVSH